MVRPEQLSSISVSAFRDRWKDRLGTGQHQRATDRLLRLYHKEGLLPGDQDEALFRCCPNSEKCWRDAAVASDPQNAGVSLPWIGKRYFDTRIAILGINFDNFGGLAGNYYICEDHIRQMEAGKRGKDGRAFARGAMQYLRVVLASLNGQEFPPDSSDVSNEELAGLWEDCAYLQRIKCAPGAERSTPTEAMIWTCPTFLAMPELRILEPRVILHLGRTNLRREWIVQEGGYGTEQGPHLERDTAMIGDRAVELISVNHPSAHQNNVIESLKQLITSLEKNPLDPPRRV